MGSRRRPTLHPMAIGHPLNGEIAVLAGRWTKSSRLIRIRKACMHSAAGIARVRKRTIVNRCQDPLPQ